MIFNSLIKLVTKSTPLHRKRGFTMIELLVAATIIAVLTAIGIVSYTSANQRARDGKRKSDLEQVRSALEIYRTDNSAYPIGSFSSVVSTLTSGDYLNTTIQDPKSYAYYYNSDGSTYTLCAYLESGGTDNCGDNCSAPANCNYQLTNP